MFANVFFCTNLKGGRFYYTRDIKKLVLHFSKYSGLACHPNGIADFLYEPVCAVLK